MEPNAPAPPPSPPPSEPVAPRLRFRRQIRSAANPLLDLPVEVLERCARFSERRTYHGLVVVLGHSRRPTATALKRIVRDVRLLPSTLFHAARAVTIPRQGSHTVWRTAYGTVTGTCRSNRKFLALEEAARAGDALAGRRAAAMRQVAATAVYHGVASVEGTNKDKCGNETVALRKLRRRRARGPRLAARVSDVLRRTLGGRRRRGLRAGARRLDCWGNAVRRARFRSRFS